MMSIKRISILCILILVATYYLHAQSDDYKGERDLENSRVTIQVDRKPLYTVFTRLINKYDVPFGFEESALDRDHRHYYFETNIATEELRAEYSSDREFLPATPRFDEHLITLNFKEAKLSDVMDAIVRQMQNYDWEIVNGVVNIVPTKGRDPRLKKLMDVKVSDFPVGMGAPIGSIQAQLMLFTPEFKKFLVENKLEARTDRPGSIFEDRTLPDGMRFSNLTFKELLNMIVKSKRGGWILQIKTQKDKPGKEFVEVII